MQVDPRLLRPFLTLAEELHFGRAADQLSVAQPALSQQIRRLETQLGVRLFERSSRRVQLTAAGRVALEQLGPALVHLDEAVATVRRAVAGEPRLRLGVLSSMTAGLVPALRAVQSQPVAVEEATLDELLRGVRGAELDLVLCYRTAHEIKLDDLDTVEIADGPLRIALPVGHPLADRDSLSITELTAEQWIVPQGAPDHLYRDSVLTVCRRHGFTPRIADTARSYFALLGLVGAGIGICLVPLLAPATSAVRLVPLVDERSLLLALRRRDTSGSRCDELVTDVLAAVRTLQGHDSRQAVVEDAE